MIGWQIAVSCVSIAALGALLFFFIWNFVKYRFVGNRYLYLVLSFAVCLVLSFYVNFSNGYEIALIPIGSSLFDALKMAVFSFDGKKLEVFGHKNFHDIFFIVQYVAASAITFFFLSLSVVLTFFKSFVNSATALKRKCRKHAKIYYIFTDSKVSVSLKLAKELLQKKEGEKGNSVTLYVSSASLKTQEGTEFRDMLVGNKIHVRAEAFTDKLAKKFVNKHFKEKTTREVVIYCMFSDNDMATKLASYFQTALHNNKVFENLHKQLKKQYDSLCDEKYVPHYDWISFKGINRNPLDKFKIFVTYHNTDIDLIYRFSKNTLHVINTLSQYDMVSSEFMFDYPITKFIDFDKARKEKNIESMNVTFFGLGSINRPIFDKMTYAYQLWGDNVHKVHYHIADQNAKAIVEALNNEYTVKSNDPLHPFLYDVDVALDKDLNEPEILDQYVKGLVGKDHRFEEDGFELFVISFGNTNGDLMAAINLRNALVKYFDEDKLKKTYIFVRRSEVELTPETKGYKPPQHFYDEGYDFNGKVEPVPIITFGGNALMPNYIKEHYSDIIKAGIDASYAYAVCHEQNKLKSEDDYKELREKVEFLWLDQDKEEVLKNTRVVYAKESKKKLLSLASKEQIDGLEKEETYLTNDENNPIILIANLEHNRWVMTTYLLTKAMPLDFATYQSGAVKDTKRNEKHVHVCMTTNAGLQALYKEAKKKDKDAAFATFYQVDVKTAALMLEVDAKK